MCVCDLIILGAPTHQECVCWGGSNVLLQQTGKWGQLLNSHLHGRTKTNCLCMFVSTAVCLVLYAQEEGDEDMMFKMVFIVNMELSMGVGKVYILKLLGFLSTIMYCKVQGELRVSLCRWRRRWAMQPWLCTRPCRTRVLGGRWPGNGTVLGKAVSVNPW